MKKQLLIMFIATIATHTYGQVDDKHIQSNSKQLVLEPQSTELTDSGTDFKGGKIYTKSHYETITPESVSDLNRANGKHANVTKKIFNITVNESGKYYLTAHVMTANLKTNSDGSSNLQEIKMFLNGQYKGNLAVSKPEWELVSLQGNPAIQMKSGENVISFESYAPFYPEIDAVYLMENANIISENVQNEKIQTKSAFTPSSDWQVYPEVIPTPRSVYPNKVSVPVTFTYYRKLNLIAGTYSFHTSPIAGDDWDTVDPVMYLFSEKNPHNYSFYDDDSEQGYHCRINNVRLEAGDYYLVVRCKSPVAAHSYQGMEGRVNVYMDNGELNKSMPISGYLVDVYSPNQGTLNYFTAKSTGIPLIFMIETATNKMKFVGKTYWYRDPMDYMWFDDARVQLIKNNSTQYQMLICAEGAMGFYYGNCDVYGAVPTVPDNRFASAFPNLKINDAMISGNISTAYNSASWAGGITDKWYWIGGGSSPFVWSSWDNYFMNYPTPRYAGASNYSRSYYGTPVIASWSKTANANDISAFSCALDANRHTHGYDWESKLGQGERIFHPLNSLQGNTYGKVLQYYYKQNNPSPYLLKKGEEEKEFSFEESVKLGLTVIEDVTLNEEQQHFINTKAKGNSQLQELYDNWLKKIKNYEYLYIDNPYSFLENEEGKALIKYATKNITESISFVGRNLFAEQNNSIEYSLLPVLFCEITKDKFGNLIKELKEDWINNSYNARGAYIAPLPETFTKKYIKKIINEQIFKKECITQPVGSIENNDKLFSIAPNPINNTSAVYLNLEKEAFVSIKIYNQHSSGEVVILKNSKMNSGKHSFSIDPTKISSGLSVCIFEIDGVSHSRKIFKY